MFDVWILLFSLLLGARAFMIHNSQRSLCLEDSADTGEVLLRKCSLDSEYQQWTWINEGMLMCVASSRCLLATQRESLQMQPCQGPEVDSVGFMWDCDRNRLISKNSSMLLSIDGRRPVLAHDSKNSKWRSLDKGDICQEKLRSKRASDPEEFEAGDKKTDKQVTLTDEEREYLRWFYRTEDPTIWKFVLLGLAFVCLLIGFLLLGMGVMASKSRREIAKYKAAAAVTPKSNDEELLVLRDNSIGKTSPTFERHRETSPPPPNGEVSELAAGDIVVTWKDGNTSCFYSEPAAEEEKQEEVPAAEPEVEEPVETVE